MSKKIGVLVIALLVFALGGCSKPAEPTVESQSNSDQNNTTTQETSEASNNDQSGQTDYTNQASLLAAVKEIFTRAENLEGLQYETVIAYQGVETVQKIWQAKGSMKMSMVAGSSESVTIITEAQTVTYDVATKQGVAYVNGETEEDSELPTINKDDIGDLKFIAEEALDGEPCIVVTDAAAGTANAKFWISKNYGIIMKSEVIDTDTNTTMTMRVKNLKTFKPDAHFFEVPKDITIIKM